MTIRLLESIQNGGASVAAGTELALSAALEADLVAQNKAVYVGGVMGGLAPVKTMGTETLMIIGATAPDDEDGRPDGTIYIQTAA